MKNGMAILCGLTLGAGLMYLLDPERGRRRRALMRDKLMSASNSASDALGAKARDLSNRARGLMHEAGSLMNTGLGMSASTGEGEGDTPKAMAHGAGAR
jgi:hypothetical protein